ncbi:cell division cycle protein 20 homolog [Amphibalanus amphitrite]|uniref:cell division cycle protein 20 homolog n=1 Tax=Amphibalanus amphitrite TaxID=1232801 RepID=UPI001C909473|nr:cell division cycle protein 20 homolog [Amphibalanus amphitrite]XP_043236792.1 cell division cycle protein 20 homolog [Amphibalanus amphitrite]XP_043236793.1 cell division cycle protein 20 homolog [Amphibalanus amphitrite]XP_043236794.1 cell division cycle protein 20 homolog [Amphibalanus amphitrite]XP_043236795.1 cell division cycle protein 20 homolog [Amphibalanus amphitrite]XP_043236796.1 cell division cycle protein 20 homolog [Amphibalanus amphitrite]XP_043247017.1 cell division cycle 
MENKFPTQRWQRKAMEQGVQKLNVPKDINTSGFGLNLSNLSLNTPGLSGGSNKSSPGRCRTPGKRSSPARSAGTPGHNTTDGALTLRPGGRTPTRAAPKTPNGGDRFIPCRGTTDMENSYHSLVRAGSGGSADTTASASFSATGSPTEGSATAAPATADQQQALAETLNNGVPRDTRILSFRAKAPQPSDSYANGLRVLYSASRSSAPRAPSTRFIPSAPDKILDAPDLLDDYYLHLLDWSSSNQLAVALGSSVYVWNAADGTIASLTQMESQEDYICSLSWAKEGSFLAVGDSTGAVQLWDVARQKRLRVMAGHEARVSTLSWNNHIISSGSRSGAIHNHDVRVPNHHVGTLAGHVQEVCGLRWSDEGRLLASGGNDNQLLVWDAAAGIGDANSEPLHTLNAHQAAVKAVSWCPWSPHLLASGGGTADRSIRFWNASTGQLLNTTTTNSQVCSLVWSAEFKEIMSGHGFSYNQLTIWKYPQMTKVIDLTGHESRVLELTVSPDGSTVASAAADETIRLWKCWQSDKSKKAKASTTKTNPSALQLRGGIR